MLLIAFFLAAQAAYAAPAESPRFTFQAAKKTFAHGRVPGASELAGRWMMVGNAIAPGAGLAEIEGYWPDGKYALEGRSGLFQSFLTFAAETDAFGNEVFSGMSQRIGVETGRVYLNEGPLAWTLTETGVEATIVETSRTCEAVYECRIVPRNGMLLCSHTVTSYGCGESLYGKTVSFMGLVKIP